MSSVAIQTSTEEDPSLSPVNAQGSLFDPVAIKKSSAAKMRLADKTGNSALRKEAAAEQSFADRLGGRTALLADHIKLQIEMQKLGINIQLPDPDQATSSPTTPTTPPSTSTPTDPTEQNETRKNRKQRKQQQQSQEEGEEQHEEGDSPLKQRQPLRPQSQPFLPGQEHEVPQQRSQRVQALARNASTPNASLEAQQGQPLARNASTPNASVVAQQQRAQRPPQPRAPPAQVAQEQVPAQRRGQPLARTASVPATKSQPEPITPQISVPLPLLASWLSLTLPPEALALKIDAATKQSIADKTGNLDLKRTAALEQSLADKLALFCNNGTTTSSMFTGVNALSNLQNLALAAQPQAQPQPQPQPKQQAQAPAPQQQKKWPKAPPTQQTQPTIPPAQQLGNFQSMRRVKSLQHAPSNSPPASFASSRSPSPSAPPPPSASFSYFQPMRRNKSMHSIPDGPQQPAAPNRSNLTNQQWQKLPGRSDVASWRDNSTNTSPQPSPVPFHKAQKTEIDQTGPSPSATRQPLKLQSPRQLPEKVNDAATAKRDTGVQYRAKNNKQEESQNFDTKLVQAKDAKPFVPTATTTTPSITVSAVASM